MTQPSEGDATLVADDGEAVREQPSRVGAYTLEALVGAGAMGAVYRARDERLGRTVALKLLVRVGARHRLRVVREARALARLSVPNVVQVFEAGELEGRSYVVMEYVDGHALDTWLEARHRSAGEILDVFRQAGRGLADAHAHGLVHRDFKPANVLVGRDGRVRVVDFGLARSQPGSSDSESHPEPASESDHTVDGLAGTPAFLAPERMALRPATPASDQFGFCVALYDALWRRHPFGDRDDGMLALAARIAEGRPDPPPTSRDVPERIRAAIVRGLAHRPEDRWPSMDALLDELVPRRRRIAPAVLGVTAAGVVVALAWPDDASTHCTDAADRLQVFWDAEREQVRSALVTADSERGELSWNAIDARMIEYALAWADAHREACARAESEQQQLDASMACLGGRRDAFEALVRVAREADVTVARRTFESVLGLPPVAPCLAADAPTFASAAALGPDAEARVQDVRARLAEVQLRLTVGKTDEAEALARAARDDADAIGHEPLRVEAQLQWSVVLVERGSYAEADVELRAIYYAAEAIAHHDVASEAAIRVAWVNAERLDRQDDAELWLRHAESVLGRHEDPHKSLRVIVYRLAFARNAGAPTREVEAEVERALDLLDGIQLDAITTAQLLNNIATVLQTIGRFDHALALYDRALGAVEPLEVEPPVLAELLHNKSLVQRQVDGASAALPAAERSLGVFERNLGPEHPTVARSLQQLAALRRSTGDVRGALADLERAERIHLLHGESDGVGVALVWTEIAAIQMGMSEFDRAVETLMKSHTTIIAALGPDDRRSVAIAGSLGFGLRRVGRLEDALTLLRDVLPRQAALGGERETELANLQALLAWTELSVGDRSAALERAREAVVECPVPCVAANELGRAAWAVIVWQDGGDPSEILPPPFELSHQANVELGATEHALLDSMREAVARRK